MSLLLPICSMYGIFTNIYPKNLPNVGKYTIHGTYGIGEFDPCHVLPWTSVDCGRGSSLHSLVAMAICQRRLDVFGPWKLVTLSWVISCYIMLYHVISCYIMLYHVISCYIMLYHVISCYIMLYQYPGTMLINFAMFLGLSTSLSNIKYM